MDSTPIQDGQPSYSLAYSPSLLTFLASLLGLGDIPPPRQLLILWIRAMLETTPPHLVALYSGTCALGLLGALYILFRLWITRLPLIRFAPVSPSTGPPLPQSGQQLEVNSSRLADNSTNQDDGFVAETLKSLLGWWVADIVGVHRCCSKWIPLTNSILTPLINKREDTFTILSVSEKETQDIQVTDLQFSTSDSPNDLSVLAYITITRVGLNCQMGASQPVLMILNKFETIIRLTLTVKSDGLDYLAEFLGPPQFTLSMDSDFPIDTKYTERLHRWLTLSLQSLQNEGSLINSVTTVLSAGQSSLLRRTSMSLSSSVAGQELLRRNQFLCLITALMPTLEKFFSASSISLPGQPSTVTSAPQTAPSRTPENRDEKDSPVNQNHKDSLLRSSSKAQKESRKHNPPTPIYDGDLIINPTESTLQSSPMIPSNTETNDITDPVTMEIIQQQHQPITSQPNITNGKHPLSTYTNNLTGELIQVIGTDFSYQSKAFNSNHVTMLDQSLPSVEPATNHNSAAAANDDNGTMTTEGEESEANSTSDNPLMTSSVVIEASNDVISPCAQSRSDVEMSDCEGSPFIARMVSRPRKLILKVITATDLITRKESFCRNAFCVVELDEPYQRHTTHMAAKTSNPYWDQHYLFEMNVNSRKITFEVFDRTKRKKSISLGRSVVVLATLSGQSCVRRSLVLQSSGRLERWDTPPGADTVPTLIVEFQFMEPTAHATPPLSLPPPSPPTISPSPPTRQSNAPLPGSRSLSALPTTSEEQLSIDLMGGSISLAPTILEEDEDEEGDGVLVRHTTLQSDIPAAPDFPNPPQITLTRSSPDRQDGQESEVILRPPVNHNRHSPRPKSQIITTESTALLPPPPKRSKSFVTRIKKSLPTSGRMNKKSLSEEHIARKIDQEPTRHFDSNLQGVHLQQSSSNLSKMKTLSNSLRKLFSKKKSKESTVENPPIFSLEDNLDSKSFDAISTEGYERIAKDS